MKSKLTGHLSSQRPSEALTSKISSTTLDLLQQAVPPLHQLLPLPQLKQPQLPRVRYSVLTICLEEEKKKEEEADVDMGGLFGDDY